MRPETVMIETDNGPVMINKTDFDPATMKLTNAADMPLPTNGGVVPASTQTVYDGNGNPVNPGDGGQFVPPTQTTTELRTDGPTVAEYVAAGYDAKSYPPAGYESRSTPEEIAAAQQQASDTDNSGNDGGGQQQQPAATPPEQLLVTKKGKKFIVVNKAGEPVDVEGINKDGYDKEADAWSAVMTLSTPKTA